MTPKEENLHWLAEQISGDVEAYALEKWTVEMPEPEMSIDSDVLFYTRGGKTFQVTLMECEELPDGVS